MQVVIGVKPQATMFGKFFRSTPAENVIGIAWPITCLNSFASVSVMTCNGGPDRYITLLSGVKKSLWFSTSSVLENFAPNDRPFALASVSKRRQISMDSSNKSPLVYASGWTVTS